MSIGLKMWPLEHTHCKKLMNDDARHSTDTAPSQYLTLSTSCSGELKMKINGDTTLLAYFSLSYNLCKQLPHPETV